MSSVTILRPMLHSPQNSAGIYLDHHSTTPVDPRVAEVVMRAMVEDFGNANSVDHKYGEAAHHLIERASSLVAKLVNCDDTDVHFTSGSTEAIRLAISHAIGVADALPLRIGLSRVEHPAVIDTAARAERLGLARLIWVDVGADARLDMTSLQEALKDGVDLLCVMAANNEVGTIYPLAEIFALAEAGGAHMLVDATQAAGRVPIDLNETPVEYLILSSHKIYGSKGVGALISSIYDAAQVHGLAATHEATPNVPGIAGMGEACRLMAEEGANETLRIASLRDQMQDILLTRLPEIIVNGPPSERLAHNLHISVPGVPNDLVVQRLRGRVAISTGAACMSGAQSASHVLQAMGLSQEIQDGALRIGLGRFTTQDDITLAAAEIEAATIDVKSALKGSSDD
ncbi:cysteine desulfurase [Rhizobium leguminosarum]|uniref:cysteine desulfurase family protein n=1 Tax=Rhizobium leguminosarum TaxID=384 RepID=UPI001C93C831|nr:cysteine desulfurase family protein [Rhizobium leguminosarum]MBY5701207.1 cysteine desulfurase [Rhizobium leguminosarum]